MNWSLLVDLLRELMRPLIMPVSEMVADHRSDRNRDWMSFILRAIKDCRAHMGNTIWSWAKYGPGQAPLKFHFPERNRIIAGLCRGSDCGRSSTPFRQFDYLWAAMEEGQRRFAIPGNILDGKSAGCHHLIQEGAKLVTSWPGHSWWIEIRIVIFL